MPPELDDTHHSSLRRAAVAEAENYRRFFLNREDDPCITTKLESALGGEIENAQLLDEAKEEADEVIRRTKVASESGLPTSIAVWGDQVEGGTGFRKLFLLLLGDETRLPRHLSQLPRFSEGQPISDLGIVALGRELDVLPRRTKDFDIYHNRRWISPSAYKPDGETIFATHNVLKVRHPDLPDETYWHEVFWGSEFSLGGAVVITVNKRYFPTTDNSIAARLWKLRNFPSGSLVRRKRPITESSLI